MDDLEFMKFIGWIDDSKYEELSNKQDYQGYNGY